MFKVFESFSGIGAQAKALERIGIPHEIVNTCDWDIAAIIAYCQIHKGLINVGKYENTTDAQINDFICRLPLSLDGKQPANYRTIKSMPISVKRMLYAAIKETDNLVNITDVHGDDIQDDLDLLTYSFPCQDLSLCGCWHGNKSGISREVNNRSGMLWEIERILKEMNDRHKALPHFLVMENVTNILSATHKADFDDWKAILEKLGYYNKIYRLNAKNFGVPQKRERAYMISVLCNNDIKRIMQLNSYFESNDLEDESTALRYSERHFTLKSVLCLDYNREEYRMEADMNQPNDTPSREKILRENEMLYDGNTIKDICVNTVTTKQDRNPNSGLIMYSNNAVGKTRWRYLTPRECFILMGFDEIDFERAVSMNPEYVKGKKILSNEKLTKLAGNSICVDVLTAIFKQIIEIDRMIFFSV